ncbi:MAG: carbohydrate-binding protein, partial [Burkholderiales bacterium PBB4]
MVGLPLRRLVPRAPPALCRMLDPQQGCLEPPLRSELFGLQRFAEHGASLGLSHRHTATHSPRTSFFPRLHLNIARLRESFEYISAQANAGYDISPAAEWLIENFHLLEAQFKEISEGLPRSYFRTLPVLLAPPLAGLPRVYAIAWAFVAHCDGAFDEDLLVHFLQAYQTTCELNISELWALPTTLRVVLMENLRRLAERVASNKGARELANLCCDQLESYDLDSLEDIRHALRSRGVERVFLAQMTHRLQESRTTAHAAYKDWVQSALPEFAAEQIQQRADQAADNLSVSNAVTALRAIGDSDWGDIVSRTSVLMGLMLTCELFAAEHPLTRDSTLHAIERLARQSKRTETDIARTMLEHMARLSPAHPAQAVPSYWLLGAGRSTLYRALGYTSVRSMGLHLPPHTPVLALYLGALLLLTCALVAALLWRSTLAAWGVAGLAVLLFFPVSEAVVALVNRLVSESSRPRHLHRLAFRHGLPAEHAVLVVIPCMLSDAAAIGQLSHRLRLHYLANLEEQAQFALLSDYLDAPAADMPGDAALLQCAQTHIATLNRLHPRTPGTGQPGVLRFILLHRARSFSTSEQVWIGWERKRGKLEKLIHTLATGQGGAFENLGTTSQLMAHTPYVVTLDSDTDLPPGRLRDLVGVAAHPYNQPHFDPQARRVTRGYGILQPRVATPLPAAAASTGFHWLFAGQFGLDPYGAASSEIYQDLFAEGSFSGKGLLQVAAVHAALAHKLPEGQVLSHDLLEGALARCGTVTDITLMEDAPSHADVAASRTHRWTRGDWQLLPLLLRARHFGISPLNAWKMLDNLRRSLVTPASLALLVLVLQQRALAPWVAVLVVLAAFSSGAMMGALAGLVPGRGDLERMHFLREALADLARATGAGLWHLALLLQHALLNVDAIARALFRMTVSKRHLLQWTTAASAQAQARAALPAL